jgi:hypothetical protein
MENSDLSRDAQQDLPGLRQWVNRLLDVANRVLENAQYLENDHFGFMALCFLGKQVDHAKSILSLGEARDVELIARSMLEGLCQLLWTANDPQSRALRWRAFAWIHDWRTMQAQIAAGQPIDASRRTAIGKALRQYDNQFLTRRARAARQSGAPEPSDPYCDNWTGHTVRQIFEWVQGDLLYLKLYKPFSDWHHWSPGGIGTAVIQQQGRVIYSSASVVDAATALATAFQCLLRTVELTDEQLGRAFAPRIAELKQGYIDCYSKGNPEIANGG